jgi:SAM-dependent methyltransferase
MQEPLFREAADHAPPRGRCLDAGSGLVGRYSEFIESFDAVTEIVNLDILGPEISKRRPDSRHRDVKGSLTEMPFDDASFDWILCAGVLTLVSDDRAGVHEISRVLAPGGAALIAVRSTNARPRTRDEREPRRYTLEGLRGLLQDEGLRVVWHKELNHLPMRTLFAVWQWQFKYLGRERWSFMPRFAVLVFGYMERWFPVGKAHSLMVLTTKQAR